MSAPLAPFQVDFEAWPSDNSDKISRVAATWDTGGSGSGFDSAVLVARGFLGTFGFQLGDVSAGG